MKFLTNDAVMGQNIQYLRRKKRLSRKNFAQLTGMHQTTLYCIEKGLLYEIDTNVLTTICRLYSISPEDLVGTDLRSK